MERTLILVTFTKVLKLLKVKDSINKMILRHLSRKTHQFWDVSSLQLHRDFVIEL